MSPKYISRREVLKSLTVGVMAGSVLSVIPVEAAEHAHNMVAAERAADAAGQFKPKFFSASQYKTLQALSQMIIPPDGESGGGTYFGVSAGDANPYGISDGGVIIHEIGTARMGSNPKTSVLNQYCQAHDVKNLFVADGASFVTNSDKNPTLTIMALSWRASDYLLEQAKKGSQ